ncbi:MAG: DNA-directed RNA polymerase subunit beta' [SAR324 cluster bacterium]|nr:DNA-directed RNA polymerase subunit beta' [SAR324 cluster bacterium]
MRNVEPQDPQKYQAIQITLASSEQILSWSSGEVKTPETINYRTLKPERMGLFCGQIFGPVKDYECICGKYKRMKHRGIRCEKCGVEVIESKVRRERLGHIKLSCPVSHVWFLKITPSKMAHYLDINVKDLERVIYFDSYVVVEPGGTDMNLGEVIDEATCRELMEHDNKFEAIIGAEGIRKLIKRRGSVEDLSHDLREELYSTKSETKRKKLVKRLKVIESFKKSKIDPANMILDVIPVISPELRPLVPLDGGRFATSDLNDLYRRIIHRNNRLKRLLDLNAPEVILKNEKRMLQESVDALFDNGRRGRAIPGANKRPLKSLSDSLKGKYGRFRQNLLGKRVDYSGRTVIVVGPQLKLNQCGMPKIMALELFKPFIYYNLIKNEKASTIKLAKKMIEDRDPAIWAALDAVIKDHPVMLNRAPTLHRLGIQAFEPILIEGKSLQLHPLVCTAFNADFDGDQMAVHVPLTIEAKMEAKVLMMAINNILSPATGKPIMIPTQDMVLGIYWMSKSFPGRKGEGKYFANPQDAVNAYEYGMIDLQAKVKVRLSDGFIDTTPGRMILYKIMPSNFDVKYVNRLLKKKDIEEMINHIYRVSGNVATVRVLDKIKNTGYFYATKVGFSISMSDMVIPEEKKQIIDGASGEVNHIHEQHGEGIITSGERYNKVVDIWSKATEDIAQKMIKSLAKEVKDDNDRVTLNPIFAMADSGARGSTNQSKQLGGMRGLMAKPSGEIIEAPITANFREGLTVHQYFISTHGARKGLADTALKTAGSGYLTRKLVDVAQDVVISTHDCGTDDYTEVSALSVSGQVIETLSERLLGRTLAQDVLDRDTGKVLFEKGIMLDEGMSDEIAGLGYDKIKIRGILHCAAERGLCAKCYGRDLARGGEVSLGEAVGVVAAQSIGEPGTQLTMRTFHIGGTVSRQAEDTDWISHGVGILSLKRVKLVKNREGKMIVVSRNSEAHIVNEKGEILLKHRIPAGAFVFFADKAKIKVGDKIAEWDPFSIPIITDVGGKIKLVDLIDGKSVKAQTDDITGRVRRVVLDSVGYEYRPSVMIKNEKTGLAVTRKDGREHPGFYMPMRAEVLVQDKSLVQAGDIIAKLPRDTVKNKDIIGGLPRVIELFEARAPKELCCMVSGITGYVEFGESMKRKRRVIVRSDSGDEFREYLIPKDKHILVMEGDYIEAGERLTDGQANPHDILRIKGSGELVNFLVNEVQEVYRLQGVKIHDKQIEIIVRQMLLKVEIVDPGDSTYLVGNPISKKEFARVNSELAKEGLDKIQALPMLQGITKAALSTDSFLSDVSFQETTKILTESSIAGRVDVFAGLKENVIFGRLIPAGTGFYQKNQYDYEVKGDELVMNYEADEA